MALYCRSGTAPDFRPLAWATNPGHCCQWWHLWSMLSFQTPVRGCHARDYVFQFSFHSSLTEGFCRWANHCCGCLAASVGFWGGIGRGPRCRCLRRYFCRFFCRPVWRYARPGIRSYRPHDGGDGRCVYLNSGETPGSRLVDGLQRRDSCRHSPDRLWFVEAGQVFHSGPLFGCFRLHDRDRGHHHCAAIGPHTWAQWHPFIVDNAGLFSRMVSSNQLA